MTMNRATLGSSRLGGWARMLQGAVMVAVAASVPAAWGAGGVQVNNVAAGQAAISQQGSVMTIRTATQNTIINYQRFSVASGSTLQFIQPNAASRVLNRIQGPEPSVIDGTLLSNGRVYIVNPAGVIFGAGAVVDVARVYAAAGHISDANFMAGMNAFTDNAGAVRNYGTIKANQIHLVGGSVANFGQILTTGDGGIVTMTAGKDVYIAEAEGPTGNASVLVKVSSDASSTKAGTGVANSGKVDAGNGAIYMGAGDLYAAGLYNNGTLKGASISLQSNANTNVNEGTIDASNAQGKGGNVEMTGDKVGLFGGTVDASGATDGGTIKIGGDFHGGPNLQASSVTVVGPTATIKADGLENGDGGQVAVWSNEATRYYGSISARGGALGGNGGFVEVSGKSDLLFVGQVNTLAPQGSIGTLLLDPQTIDINTSGTAVYTSLSQVNQFSNPDLGGNHRLDPSTINNASSNVVLQATGNITFSSPVSIAANNVGLTAQAGGSLTVSADITTKGGAIFLSAGDQGTSGAGSSVNGLLTIDNVTISTTGGSATSGVITLKGHDVVVNTAATLDAGTGTVEFATNVAAQVIHVDNNAAADTVGAYNVSLGELDTALGTASKIVIGEQGVQTGAVTWDSGANYSYDTVTGPDRTVEIRLNTSGALGMAGNLTPHNTNDHLNLTLSGGAVTVSGALSLTGTAAGAPGVFVSGGTSFTATGAISNASDINILNSGAVSIQALLGGATTNNVRISGSTVGESGGGAITATSLAIRATDDVTLNGVNTVATLGAVNSVTGKVINITTAGAVNLDTVSAAATVSGLSAFAAVSGIQTTNGLITVQAGGNLSISDPVAAGTGNVSLSTAAASAGNINGVGTNVISGNNITLNADGGIGVTTAPTLAPTGNVSLTSAGANAAGNISVAFFTAGAPGTLTTSTITGLTTDGATPQTIALSVQGGVIIDGALAVTGDQLNITATGNINGDGNTAHALSGPTIDLTAQGIGGTNAVSVNPTTAATFTTLGSGSLGDIHLTTTSALNLMTFDTDLATAQHVAVENAADLTVGANVSVGVGDTLLLHAGMGGTGTLKFTGTPTITADAVVLWSGIGDGSATAATVDVSGGLILQNVAATGAPTSVTIRQDAALTDAALTTANFTGAALPTNLTLRSDGGAVTLATAANVGGTNLSLTASKSGNAVNINTALTGGTSPLSLTATATTINVAANVATTAAQTYNGAVMLTGNVALSGTNLTVNGTVDALAGQTFSTDFTGATAFTGSLGAGTGGTLGSFTVVSEALGTVAFGSGSGTFAIVASGPISIGEATTLRGDTTVTGIGGTADVTFSKTIDSQTGSGFTLAVISPGVTWFEGNIGSTTALHGLHTDAAGSTKLGNAADFSVTVASPITFDDDVTLLANTSLDAGVSGTVAFNKTLNSEASKVWTLTVNAGVSTTFANDVGAAVNGELGKIVTTTGALVLGPGGTFVMKTKTDTVTNPTATGVMSLSSTTTTLLANATLSAGSDVTVGGMLASGTAAHFGIAVLTTGNTQFSGGTSAVAGTLLEYILTDAGGTTKFGNGSPITVVTSDSQQYGDEVVLLANTTIKGSSLTFNGGPTSIDAATFDLTLVSNAMSFAGAVTGAGGQLTLEPFATTDNIVVGATASAPNTLLLGATDMAVFSGFALTTIGYANGSGVLTVASGAPVFGTSTHLQMGGGGTITVQSAITANGSLGLTATTIDLGASLTSNGSGLTLDGATVLTGGGAITLQSFGTAGGAGNITVIGSVNATGGEVLNLAANGLSGNGNIDLQGVVGGSTALGGLNASGATFTVHSNISTAGAINIGATQVLLAHNGTAATSTVTIVTGGNALHIAAPVDGDGSGSVNLVISTSSSGVAAPITLGSIGASGTLNNLTLISTGTGGDGDITVADVTIHGAFFSNGGNFTNSGVMAAHGISLTQSGAVSIGNGLSSAGFAVSVHGTAITSAAGAPISGSTITVVGTGLVTLNDVVTGTGAVSITGAGIAINLGAPVTGDTVALIGGAGNVGVSDVVNAANGFSSTSSGGFSLAATGAINTTNTSVTITHNSALVFLSGPIAAGTGTVTVSGRGVLSGSNITGGVITLNGGTASGVLVLGAITGSGAVSMSGATGVSISSASIVSGDTVTINAATSDVTVSGLVNATHGFSSTSTGLFTLDVGAGITTVNSDVTINHAGSLVTLNGPIAAGTGSVSVTGKGVTTHALGSMGGGSVTIDAGALAADLAGAVTASGPLSITGTGIRTHAGAPLGGTAITLTAGSGNVQLDDTVTGTGAFSSSGVDFTNNAIVSAHGITINHTGVTSINAALSSAGFGVTVNGTTITVASGAPVTGSSIMLTATGPLTISSSVHGTGAVSLTGASVTINPGAPITGSTVAVDGGSGNVIVSDVVTAANGFTSTASGFFTLAVTGAIHTTNQSVTISHGGLITLDGPITAGTGTVTVSGLGIGSIATGTIGGGAITLNGGGAPVGLAGAVIGSGAVSITGAGVTLNPGAAVTGDTVALNGLTGNVLVSDVVNAANGFSSTSSGLFTLAAPGAINTTNKNVTIAHGGLVALGGPLAAGTGTVTITGAGVSQTAGIITSGRLVLVGTGVFSLTQTNAVGALQANVTGALSLTNGAALNVTGVNTNGGALTLVTTTGDITFSGTASAAVMTLTAAAVHVNGTMSAATLTVNGDLSSTAAITSNGAVTITGSANLGAALTSTTGSIGVTGTASGTGSLSALAGNITVGGGFSAAGASAGGFVSIGGPVTMSSGGTISAGSSITLLDGANMTGSLMAVTSITVTGDATIHGSLNAGTNILFNNTADITGNVRSTGGAVTFTGNATVTGDISAAAALLFSGTANIHGNMTAGTTISVSSTADITGNVVSVGGSTTFSGNATVAGNISSSTTLAFGAAATITGNMTAGGAITFAGPANVTGNITSISAGATFLANATVHGNMSVATALAFLGTANLNSTATAGGNLTVTGNATLSGSYTVLNVSIPSAVTLAGNTTLNASGVTGISLGNIKGSGNLTLKSTSAASSIVVGTIGVDGTPIGDLAFKTDGLTNLHNSIFAHSVSFASAAGGALAAVPDHASIVNAGSLVIVSETTFSMAENEKLTAYEPTLAPLSPGHANGSILIWAKSSSSSALTVGDVNATGRIILAAGTAASPGTIVFRNRRPGAVTGGAAPQDLGADIFALGLTSDDFVMPAGFVEGGSATSPLKFQGNIDVNNTDATASSSGAPRFLIGAIDTTNAETLWFTRSAENGAIINSKLLFVNQFAVPTLAQFVDPAVPHLMRDIEVTGVTRVPNAAQGTIIPRDVQTLSPERSQAISGALRDYLREVGIYARDLRTDELIDYLIGRGLYDDVPYELNPDQGAYQVAVNRLPYAPVLPVVDAARRLLFKQELDQDGKPVMENGKPKMVSQAEDVAKAIGAAWQAYLDDTKIESHKPAEFRAYLELHEKDDAKFALALDYLNQIRDLLVGIKNLGLTPAEFEVSRNKLLTKLRFANVDEKDFPEMIDGPSSRTNKTTVVTAPAPATTVAPK